MYLGASLLMHLYTKTRARNFLLSSSVLMIPAIFNKWLYGVCFPYPYPFAVLSLSVELIVFLSYFHFHQMSYGKKYHVL